MHAELVESLVLEVTTEADEDEEENKPDGVSFERENSAANSQNSVHSQLASSRVQSSSKLEFVAEEPWVVQTPKHTYQRKGTNTIKQIDCPPNENSICQNEIDLVPILKGGTAEKYCIEFEFPPLNYRFEDMRALILLQLEASEFLEEKESAIVPIRNLTKPVASSTRSTPNQKEGLKHRNINTSKIPQTSTDKPETVKKRRRSKQCEFCGKLYTSPPSSHLESCRSIQDKITCSECGSVLASKKSFRRHRKIHLRQSGVKPHSCDVCKKGFYSRLSVRRHMLIHKGEKPHVCEVCGRAFRDKGHLTYHLTIHTGVKKMRCPDCGKQFMYPSIMKLHKCRFQED